MYKFLCCTTLQHCNTATRHNILQHYPNAANREIINNITTNNNTNNTNISNNNSRNKISIYEQKEKQKTMFMKLID